MKWFGNITPWYSRWIVLVVEEHDYGLQIECNCELTVDCLSEQLMYDRGFVK